VTPLADLLRGKLLKRRFAAWRQRSAPAWHADDHSNGAPFDEARTALYARLCELKGLAGGPIDYLEFGVSKGASLRWWVDANADPASRFVGFDTFLGLPEAWDMGWGVCAAGTYAAGGVPPELGDSRVSYEVGLFQDTLPGYVGAYRSRNRKLIHLDADLYSSTICALRGLAPILRPGDILLFDEFSVAASEFRAFLEFRWAHGVRVRPLLAANNCAQVAFEVLGIGFYRPRPFATLKAYLIDAEDKDS
jgi:O-methyltransferase